jgi:hypothetical protein
MASKAAYYGTKPALNSATQAAAVTDVAALTSSNATGGDAPTEAEYNALRADVVAIRTTMNSLLAKLRTAGLLAP